jgi:hypothetical protein
VPLPLYPAIVIAWMKDHCSDVDRCPVSERVVVIQLLPCEVDISLEMVLLLQLCCLWMLCNHRLCVVNRVRPFNLLKVREQLLYSR